MNTDLELFGVYSIYLLGAIIFEKFDYFIWSNYWQKHNSTLKILGPFCNNLVKLLGGCLPRKKNEAPVASLRGFQEYLDDEQKTYSCVHCRAHLASQVNLISKSFQGSQGRAYLFDSVVNIASGPAEQRVLLTGLHHVADIHCQRCKTTLGWKYEHAYEHSQKYKEGKFIIELVHMFKDNGWNGD
jgi:hypothetical protein